MGEYITTDIGRSWATLATIRSGFIQAIGKDASKQGSLSLTSRFLRCRIR